VLAHAGGAISTRVAGIAIAPHGLVLIPKLVEVVIVVISKLTDGLASSVARAHAIGRHGARGALASRALIALETIASSGRTVANSLIGALAVSVSGINQLISIRVLHTGVLLIGSLGENVVSDNHQGGGISQLSSRSI
jgi:hypothetical protein